MAPFIEVLEFLYNNFIVVGIIGLSVTLFILVLHNLYLEYRFNKRLSMKKMLLRNLERYRLKQLTFRRFLGLALPIALFVLILIQAFSRTIPAQEHAVFIEDEADILNIYENFYAKFITTPFEPQLERPFEPSQSDQFARINEFKGMDFIAQAGLQLFILNQKGVQVTRLNGVNSSFERTLTLIEPDCEAERYSPEGLFINGNQLVAVVSQSLGQCSEQFLPYHLRDHSVEVFVFDLSSQTLTLRDRYSFSGILSQLHRHEGVLMMGVTNYLAFSDPSFTLSRALPRIRINARSLRVPIEGIVHIENTVPNSFISLHALDLERKEVASQTLLTDFVHTIEIRKDAILFMTDSFVFAPASEIFEFRNPIERVRTSLTQFDFRDGELNYHLTHKVDGERLEDGLHLTDDATVMITRQPIRFHIHYFDETLERVHEQTFLPRFMISKIVFDNHYLYFLPASAGNPTTIFKRTEEHEYHLVRELDVIFMQEHLRQLDSTWVLGVSNLQNNMLNANIIDRSNAVELTVRAQSLVDYSVYGYILLDDFNPIQEVVMFSYLGQRILMWPVFSGALRDLEAESSSSMVTFRVDHRGLQEGTAFTLQGLESFRYPFAYRSIVHQNYWVHITPGGLIFAPLGAWDQADRIIRFP